MAAPKGDYLAPSVVGSGCVVSDTRLDFAEMLSPYGLFLCNRGQKIYGPGRSCRATTVGDLSNHRISAPGR